MKVIHLVIFTLSLAIFTGVSDHANAQHPQNHAGVHQVAAAQHENQPDTCNNMHDNAHPCDCHNAQNCDAPAAASRGEDPKCQVYCRPDACKCVSPCDT